MTIEYFKQWVSKHVVEVVDGEDLYICPKIIEGKCPQTKPGYKLEKGHDPCYCKVPHVPDHCVEDDVTCSHFGDEIIPCIPHEPIKEDEFLV